jgi:hypothetical protein
MAGLLVARQWHLIFPPIKNCWRNEFYFDACPHLSPLPMELKQSPRILNAPVQYPPWLSVDRLPTLPLGSMIPKRSLGRPANALVGAVKTSERQ